MKRISGNTRSKPSLEPDIKKQKISENISKGIRKSVSKEREIVAEPKEEEKKVEVKIDEPNVNEFIDHTVLKAGTTWEDVKKVCEEAIQHKFIAVCIPACFVKQSREFLK